MNRFEYMRRLEELLSDIAPSEKEEALTYYNDYFNDAGEADEQQVMEELGTPEQVAAVVKEGLGLADGQNVAASQTDMVTEGNTQMQQSTPETSKQQTSYQGQPVQGAPWQPQKKAMPVWAIVLIVIGLIFCSPVILVLLCVVFVVFLVVFSLIFAFGVSSLALYVTAFVCILLGCFVFPVSRLLTGALMGSGFLAAAAGILLMLLTVLLSMSVPSLCKGTAWIWHKIFHKG